MEAPFGSVVPDGRQQHANGRTGEDKPGPGKEREDRELPERPHVPLQPQRPGVDGVCRAHDRRRHRDRRRDRRRPRHAMRGRAAESPHDAGDSNRGTHDVEDVHAEQRDRVAARRDDESLQTEQKAEDENFQAAAADHVDRRSPAPGALGGARGGEHDRETGQPQEQRRRKPAEHCHVAERRRAANDRTQAGPGIGGVRLDHQQHRNAARPVDVRASMGGRHDWW